MQHKPLAIGITLALITPSIFANSQQNEEQSIEKIAVVSSKVAMPLREIATSVSVINQQQIEARGYANLTDVLKNQAAIGVTNSGGVGTTTSLRVRGEEGYRTLVRIDGVDISDPTGTQVQPQLGHLQAANIQRVEILRGSQGLAYGADAGGVINIFSPEYSTPLAGSLAAEAGRYNTSNVKGDIGGRYESIDYYLSGASFDTQGFNSRLDDTSQDLDGYANNTLHTRLAYQLNPELSAQIVVRSNQGKGDFDNCGFGESATNDCQTEFTQTNFRAALNYDNNHSAHEISIAKTLVERENFNQQSSSYLTKGFTERFEYLGHTELNSQHAVVYGIDWEKESISSAQQYRYNKGYFIEYQSELIKNWFSTLGVRHDDNDDFGQHTTYRLSSAYIWSIAGNEVKLRGAYGTGFRAPSLYEIEYNRGPWSYAPASETNLIQEESKGYEVALGLTTEKSGSFELVYFDQTIHNSIYFDLATFSGYLQDTGKSFSKGIEIILDYPIADNWRVYANHTYNKTQDTAGDQRIRRPKNLTNFSVDYAFNKLTFTGSVRFVRNFTEGSISLDNYKTFDVSARYQALPELSIYARIENAFDTDYQDVPAFNTSGQAPHIGLKYQF
ncbi:TonB-dependent receptor [Paraglaciecola aquimarina]|uniref:TonB-dependent receptor n=1 Tax=Paraglaciecola algarum TaxID=3050085 RepID=A0ABS9DAS5_9ALTE|nr:TonB-dependent receptor [Paraglaciecola sp. G1-23]MCF2949915.1 TonB-dependent receptor [Paraglaciecola sp. G1-23]